MEKNLKHTMEMMDLNCAPTTDYEAQLLECIQNEDTKKLKKILQNDEININHVYGHPHNKTILQIACSKTSDNDEIINTLLTHGADPYLENKNFKNKQCIHFAAENTNKKILELIVNTYHNTKETQKLLKKCNVFIYLIQHIYNSKKYAKTDENIEEKYTEILDCLLNHDININIPDSKGWTPIYAAAKYDFREIVAKLLTSGKHLDLDNFKDYNGKSARNLITEKELYNDSLPEKLPGISGETLKSCINSGDIDSFKNTYEITKYNLTDEEKYALLHVATRNNLCTAVKIIAEDLGDVSKTLPGEKTALESACIDGYHNIVEILLNKQPNSECVSKGLIELSKQNHSDREESDVNYNRCTELLLSNDEIKINKQDTNDNTPLHYAVKYQNPDMILQLLRKGASLASKNNYGTMAIADINADVLKMHLDECIIEASEKHNDNESKYITINFTSLLAPRDNATIRGNNNGDCKINVNEEPLLKQTTDDQRNLKINENPIATFAELLTEMDVLKYMSTSPELKPLLTHPVIMTFLYLKWYRIRKFFYINLAIYLMFFISLLTYVFFCYNEAAGARSRAHQFIVNFSHLMVGVMAILLLIREMAQIFIFKWRYLKIFENWLEISLLCITLAIVIDQNEEVIIKQLAAVAILLSAIDFLLLVGQIPSLSTNIMMLRTVSWTFLKLLLWYSILIIAFALSFYTLFKNNEGIPNGNKKNETQQNGEDEENNFFIDPGLSMFKTIVMLTGEFDASDIKFDAYPIISHLVFLSFVFLIAIVLFNLLNGLAVSDTQMIKSDAELYSQIVRVEHISQVERILLTKKFCRFIKYVRDICLFPSNVKSTEVKIYQHNNWAIKFGDEQVVTTVQCYRCAQISLEKKVQRKIKAVLQGLKEEKLRMEKECSLSYRLGKLEEQQKQILSLLQRNST